LKPLQYISLTALVEPVVQADLFVTRSTPPRWRVAAY
jgi:hypothetical protein